MSLHDPVDLSLLNAPLGRGSATFSGTKDARAVPGPRVGFGRLATATAVIYGTLLLVLLANPRPVAAWLDEFEPNPVVERARAVVDRVGALSDALGITKLSEAVRSRAKEIIHRSQG